MTYLTEPLSGTCQQFLFSPKGAIEGMLLTVAEKCVQVALSANEGVALARMYAIGNPIHLHAMPDRTAKVMERVGDGVHAVYLFKSLVDSNGHPVTLRPENKSNATLNGTVKAMHFARHGQPNGVMLETGDFVHLGPDAMVKSGIKVGSKVHAIGRLSQTVLNTKVLEAKQVYGVEMH